MTPDQPAPEQDLSWYVTAAVTAAAVGVGFWLWRRGVLRRGGLTVGGLRSDGGQWSPWPWYALSVMAVSLVLVSIVGGAVGMILVPRVEVAAETVRAKAMGAAGYLVFGVIGAVTVLTMLGRGNNAEDVRIQPTHVRRGAGCFVLAVPLLLVVGLAAASIYTRVTGGPPPSVVHDTLKSILANRGDPWALVLVAGALLAAPIFEEVIFRVLLQTAIQQVTRSAWLGILASSVLFTVMHWGAVPPETFAIVAAQLMALSVCLGVAYERTRAAGVPVVMHLMFNMANVALAVTGKWQSG